jgi:hypothetical protein
MATGTVLKALKTAGGDVSELILRCLDDEPAPRVSEEARQFQAGLPRVMPSDHSILPQEDPRSVRGVPPLPGQKQVEVASAFIRPLDRLRKRVVTLFASISA